MTTSKRWKALGSILTLLACTPPTQAITFYFDYPGDWPGTPKMDISQSAFDNRFGTGADIGSWEVYSWLFNNLDGGNFSDYRISSSDPGVVMTASFSLSDDRKTMLLNLFVSAADPRYTYSTSADGNGSTMARGFDWSRNPPGSYWQHTTRGTWRLEAGQSTPEGASTFGLLLISGGVLGAIRRRMRPLR